MNLQLQIVKANSRLRSPEAGALFAFWSRAFSHMADACTMMSLGSYPSCAAAATDCLRLRRVAALTLGQTGSASTRPGWKTPCRRTESTRRWRSTSAAFEQGSALAEDERLGSLFTGCSATSRCRISARPLFQVAPDSNLQKISIAFGDSALPPGLGGAYRRLAAAALRCAADGRRLLRRIRRRPCDAGGIPVVFPGSRCCSRQRPSVLCRGG